MAVSGAPPWRWLVQLLLVVASLVINPVSARPVQSSPIGQDVGLAPQGRQVEVNVPAVPLPFDSGAIAPTPLPEEEANLMSFFHLTANNRTHHQLFARNISDRYHGEWTFVSNSSAPLASRDWLFQKPAGSFALDLRVKPTPKSPTFDIVAGELTLRDGPYSTDRPVFFHIQGLYFHGEGLLLLFGNRLDDDALSDVAFRLPTNATALDALANTSSVRDLVNVTANESIPCFLRLLVQMRPLPIDALLAHPGIATKPGPRHSGRADPRLSLTGMLVSPNCSLAIEIAGDSWVFATYARQAVNYVLLLALLSFWEIMLLIKQMEHTENQAALIKVSLLTLGQQAHMDSNLCLIHLTIAIIFDDLFNAFIIAAFLKFIVFSLFEMRYLILVWKARRPNVVAWGLMRSELTGLYLRFYLALFVSLAAFYIFGPSQLFVFLLYSFWLPQIWSYARRCERGAMLPKYVIGLSLSRLFIPSYVYLCPANLLHAEPAYGFGLLLWCWVGLQAAVVLGQDKWGPRFFVPAFFFPPPHDYHRPVQPAELRDCVICMSPVDTRAPGEYMITPCGHLFHRACLMQWVVLKMECPSCRAALPAIES